MDTVRLKYVGEQPFLDRSLSVPVTWNPGDVRHWPRRKKPNDPCFKPMKGKSGKDTLPLPVKSFPDDELSPRDLEWTIGLYSLDELHEMMAYYIKHRMRFHKDVVDQEIYWREYNGED